VRDRLERLLVETRGGPRRAAIIEALDDEPANPSRLAERLGLHDYTVRYHLAVLERHGVVVSGGDGYGEPYFLTEQFDHHYDAFERVLDRLE
jgi:DNA-binding transcriptional ArsR family regulator